MVYKLTKNDYKKVRPLFTGLHYHLVIFSIIEGRSPGWIYVDDVDQPQAVLVWDHTEGGFYLAGDETNNAFNQSLNQRILQEIYPAARAMPNCAELVLNYHPDRWENKLDVVLRHTNAMKHTRKHFFFKELNVDWRSNIPDGFVMARIDEALLSKTRLKNIDHIVEWIRGNWQSADNFMEKGFGFCLLHKNTITSWCLADYVVDSSAEIGRVYFTFGASFENYRRDRRER